MPGTVNPSRYVSEDERRALVTIEAVERLMVKMHRLLEPDHGEEGADENTRLEVQSLLESAIDLTVLTTCTSVKSQSLSDHISGAARAVVAKIVASVDQDMAPLREEG